MLFYSSILDLSLKKLVFIELYVCKCWIVFILKRNDWSWRDGAGHGEMEHVILVMLFYSIYYKLFLYYNCTDHCFFI